MQIDSSQQCPPPAELPRDTTSHGLGSADAGDLGAVLGKGQATIGRGDHGGELEHVQPARKAPGVASRGGSFQGSLAALRLPDGEGH